MPLAAYHNDPAVRREAVKRAREHRNACRITKGMYGMLEVQEPGTVEFSGCAIGCLATPSNLIDAAKLAKLDMVWRARADLDPQKAAKRLRKAFNFSWELTALIDAVFENLPPKIAQDWPSNIVKAIPAGADVSARAIQKLIKGSPELQQVIANRYIHVARQCPVSFERYVESDLVSYDIDTEAVWPHGKAARKVLLVHFKAVKV